MTINCLIVCENRVMVTGVKLLLAKEVELKFHVLCADIEAELAQALAAIRPDVVIMDEAVRATLPNHLWRWVTSLPDLSVIIINQKDNVTTIYQYERARELHVRDLARVVRSHGSHFRPS